MTGGRCHGPNCTRSAVVEDGFCSESCQVKWNGQFDIARQPPAPRPEPHPTQADLNAALAVAERFQEESERPRQLNQVRLHSVSFSEQPSPFLTAAVEEATPEVRRAVAAAIDRALADITTEPAPQIAPPNPQVGYLTRAFHWLFGRTP